MKIDKNEALGNQKLKQDSYRDKIRLRIDEIDRLKKEVENNRDTLINSKAEFKDLLEDLKSEEDNILDSIRALEEKLEELGVSRSYIDRTKDSLLIG